MRLALLLSLLAAALTLQAQDAFINEVNYDTPGSDGSNGNREFVEVAIDLTTCPGGTCDPADFSVIHYDGNGGDILRTDAPGRLPPV